MEEIELNGIKYVRKIEEINIKKAEDLVSKKSVSEKLKELKKKEVSLMGLKMGNFICFKYEDWKNLEKEFD